MCAGVAAEIDDSLQIKYRVKNIRGVQTLKNTLKATHSTKRLFQNTNKTAKERKRHLKDFTEYKKAESEHRYNNLPLQDSIHLVKLIIE